MRYNAQFTYLAFFTENKSVFPNIYLKVITYYGYDIFSNMMTATCENVKFISAKNTTKLEHSYKNRNI